MVLMTRQRLPRPVRSLDSTSVIRLDDIAETRMFDNRWEVKGFELGGKQISYPSKQRLSWPVPYSEFTCEDRGAPYHAAPDIACAGGGNDARQTDGPIQGLRRNRC